MPNAKINISYEKDLAIMIRREDIKLYEKGLWSREELGRFFTAIVEWAFMDIEPKAENYQDNISDRYLYYAITETISRIKSSWGNYLNRCEANAIAGKAGGIASGKARRAKAEAVRGKEFADA